MKRSGDPDGGCDADAELNELGRNDPFHKLLPLFFLHLRYFCNEKINPKPHSAIFIYSRPAKQNLFGKIACAQIVDCKSEVRDRIACDQMLLNDSLQDFRRTSVIPDTFWIHDGDRPAHADAQTVGFGSEYKGFRSDKSKLFQPALQEFP